MREYNNSLQQQRNNVDNSTSQQQNSNFTEEDKKLILLHFVQILKRIGKKQLDARVTGTAIVYMKRFYLNNDITECDPWLLIQAAILLASKIEESQIYIKNISSALPSGVDQAYSQAEIIECEYYLMEELHYQLVVFHPYRAFKKFIEDLKGTEQSSFVQKAWNIINDSYYSNLCLAYPPYMIALAALYMAAILEGDTKLVSNLLISVNNSSHEISNNLGTRSEHTTVNITSSTGNTPSQQFNTPSSFHPFTSSSMPLSTMSPSANPLFNVSSTPGPIPSSSTPVPIPMNPTEELNINQTTIPANNVVANGTSSTSSSIPQFQDLFPPIPQHEESDIEAKLKLWFKDLNVNMKQIGSIVEEMINMYQFLQENQNKITEAVKKLDNWRESVVVKPTTTPPLQQQQQQQQLFSQQQQQQLLHKQQQQQQLLQGVQVGGMKLY